MAAPTNVDEYIAAAPESHRPLLEAVRAAIREAAPDAEERMSYGMPYYFRNGRFAYFSLHRTHVGLYPFHDNDVAGTALEGCTAEKATLRLPLGASPEQIDAVKTVVRRRAAAQDAEAQQARG